jgi:poly-gamma-glutamate synthesis protein (capsule biosynthesis protein)
MRAKGFSRVCVLCLLPWLAGACGPGGPGSVSNDCEDGEAYEPYRPLGKADGFGGPDAPITFSAACDAGERLVIAAVGDVLLHTGLQKQALADTAGFASLWSKAGDLLRQADVTYANLEGPTAPGVTASGKAVKDPGAAFDGRVYTSYPQFNYHPSLIDDLKASGVDVVSTANNHALDRRALGVDRTIDELRRAGMPFTGTRRRGDSSPWYAITETRGFTLAWLACTYSTNGIPDVHDQVLDCYGDQAKIEALVADLAGRPGVEAVIVTPHWGLEYHATPRQKEISLAHRLLNAGATVILGSHPHVLQPWQKYETADGRETLVIFSLGNFVSGQRHLPRRSTLLLYLGLTRRTDGSVVLNGARYVPLYMSRDYDARPWEIEVIDRAGGPGASRALTVGMLGLWNLQRPWEPPAPSAQCDPGWQAPHAHDGWIGGACSSDLACGGTRCADELPGGLCTSSCQLYCPDQAGRPTTFCADLGLGDGGSCVLRCTEDSECRPGYRCLETARFGEPNTVVKTCRPAP